MRILLYSLCVLLLLNCGQKGDLVRPKSAAEKLAEALATPSTSQEATVIDVVAPPAKNLDESEIQEFEVIDFDEAEILDKKSMLEQDKYLMLAASSSSASTPNSPPSPDKICPSENGDSE